MKRLSLIMLLFFGYTAINAQQIALNDYQFVLVPDSYAFLKEPDKYQLNSMTVFYLKKSGFNAYLTSKAPNLDRCAGLYVNVENVGSLLGGRLQVVLSDCNNNEVYRSEIGRSKVKDYKLSYQDALRRAFNSIAALGVKQKEVPLKNGILANARDGKLDNPDTILENAKSSNISGKNFPESKFSSYSHGGKSYLLRKTEEGYSLYKENPNSENGLELVGKIIVMENAVKFLDNNGKVSDVDFDTTGNLTLKDAMGSAYYHLSD